MGLLEGRIRELDRVANFGQRLFSLGSVSRAIGFLGAGQRGIGIVQRQLRTPARAWFGLDVVETRPGGAGAEKYQKDAYHLLFNSVSMMRARCRALNSSSG